MTKRTNFKLENNNLIDNNFLNKKIIYFKKIVEISNKESEDHKKYLKMNLKKIFLIKSFIIKFFKINFFSSLISGCPELWTKSKKLFSRFG